MGACSSVAKDQATSTETSVGVVPPSDSRRVSQASVAYSQSNRRVSQSGVGDVQSTSANYRRRSSVSFRQPLVSTKWENGDQLNAPLYGSQPLVESTVAYQDVSFHNPQEIIVAEEDAYNTSNILSGPIDVPMSHPITQVQPAFETSVETKSNVVQMEPVIVDSSALPYSGYEVDDNGVVVKSPGETVVAELHGNKVYDPLIGEMVYVLDENAPVDGLEIITTTEINAGPSVLSNDVAGYVEEPL